MFNETLVQIHLDLANASRAIYRRENNSLNCSRRSPRHSIFGRAIKRTIHIGREKRRKRERPRGSSENLSVALCFRRVSRGNAARRSGQATEAVLSSTLPVSATLLIAPFHRAFSKGEVGRHFPARRRRMRRGRKEKKRKRGKSETRERLKERGISVANCRRELPSQTSSKCRGSHEKIHTYIRATMRIRRFWLCTGTTILCATTTWRLSMRPSKRRRAFGTADAAATWCDDAFSGALVDEAHANIRDYASTY